MKTQFKKWARKCSATGEGMNEGWVWGDGVFYTSTIETTLSECRKDREHILYGLKNLGCDLSKLDTVQSDDDLKELESSIERANNNIDTDSDLLTIGYYTDYVYYTEWEDEDDFQYFEMNGKLHDIEDMPQVMEFEDSGDGVEYEIWADADGNRYRVPIELVRDFKNMEKL